MTITPFGAAVEPDVYWRKASDSGSGSKAAAASPAALGALRVSVGSHRRPASSGATASSPRGSTAPARIASVVSAARGRRVPRDRPQPRLRAVVRTRRIGGDRHHPGVQAAEEGDDEVEPRRVEQQRPLARRDRRRESRRDRRRPAVELPVGEAPPLGLAVRQKGERHLLRPLRGTRAQETHDRGHAGLHPCRGLDHRSPLSRLRRFHGDDSSPKTFATLKQPRFLIINFQAKTEGLWTARSQANFHNRK